MNGSRCLAEGNLKCSSARRPHEVEYCLHVRPPSACSKIDHFCSIIILFVRPHFKPSWPNLPSCLDGKFFITSTTVPRCLGIHAFMTCTFINRLHLFPHSLQPLTATDETTAYLVSCYPLLLSSGYRFLCIVVTTHAALLGDSRLVHSSSRFTLITTPYRYRRNNCIPGFLLSTAP